MTSIDNLVQEGRILQNAGHNGDAINRFSEALESIRIGDPLYAPVHNDLAYSLVMSGNLDGAFDDSFRAFAHANDGQGDQKARALIDLSYIVRKEGKIERAREFLITAGRFATQNSFWHAKALEFEGRTYLGTAETDKMISLFEEAEVIYEGLRFGVEEFPELTKRLADTSHLLGIALYDQGRYGEAKGREERALEAHQELDNKVGIYNAATYLGRIALEEGGEGFAAAIRYFAQAGVGLTPGESPDDESLARLELDQARAFSRTKMPEVGAEHFQNFIDRQHHFTPYLLGQIRHLYKETLEALEQVGATDKLAGLPNLQARFAEL